MDAVTDYATKVLAGTYGPAYVASRMVHQACRRHLDDIEHQAEKGLDWRIKEAEEAIAFFAEILVLPERTNADESSQTTSHEAERPFILQPWQQFIVGSAFGWYTGKGFRRFRECYIETAKGSGKTPLGAGMMLYMLVADGQPGAQIFAAAVTRDQAKLAFTDAERMVEASPCLAGLLTKTVNNLAYADQGSFFRAVSSEKRGLDGKRVHGALIDELHEHSGHVVVNKMRAGTKGNRNALIVKITNSGFDRASVCWHHHEYSRKVLDGTIENETWFAFIAGLDPCQACLDAGRWFPGDDCPDCDQWSVEGEHWRKANPNLGISLPWQYLRERVAQAKGMPSEVSDVLRFNFCVWTHGSSRAFDMGRWASCLPMPPESELLGADCFGCLDLGETDDFSAWGRIWVLADGRLAVKMRYWIPDVAIERYPNRPYQQWERAKILDVTEGPVTDYGKVRETIINDYRRDGMQAIFFDKRSARETAQLLMAEGITMVEMAQGFALNEALKKLSELVVSGDLCHGMDPILSWMASNTVLLTNSKGERRLAKERSPEKIDGIAALTMGIEGALVRRERVGTVDLQLFVFGGRA
jgi:phage terminase large subunit-like protein